MSELVAVLGPTNTGKTHYALERMLAHSSGMIGLPLRLLAREVYDKVVAQKGEDLVALVTGEERIWPDTARYFVATVEAMPLSQSVDFMAIDEIQLAADPDRGHVFTHRILHARGRSETLLLGSATMESCLRDMGLKVETNRRERFSELTYAGPIKVTKLPKRSAIVAFSAEEVYAIAELLRRQRGGSAVVMGALSPRTRNAQVELYQSGEVDYLVATDAIGMGINLDVDHVAFASRSKFDGRRRRRLTAAETGQIAGRAGRYRTDGTFGETGDCQPFEPELVGRLESHHFEAVKKVWWRNSDLDYGSLDAFLRSLTRTSGDPVLQQCEEALDEQTLRLMAQEDEVRSTCNNEARLRRLWDICTLPDFRQAGTDGHFRLVQSLWKILADPSARIPCDWMDGQLRKLDNMEGDLQTLQFRLAAIRTWTYAANRNDWLEDASRWRDEARAVEDRLSDALHEKLTQRFVDRRTTALMKGLKKEDALAAGVSASGEVTIEGHSVGRLNGLTFKPDVNTKTLEGRAVRNAAFQALRPVLALRLRDIAEADKSAFRFDDDDNVTFDEEPIARLKPGHDWMSPVVELIGGEQGEPVALELARARVAEWVRAQVELLLPRLYALKTDLEASGLEGMARGLAFRLLEAGAAIDMRDPGNTTRFSAEERDALKSAGLRTGRVSAYVPEALKPLQQKFISRLVAAQSGQTIPVAPSGAGSFEITGDDWPEVALHANGYLKFGPRAIRADLAERLAWEIDKRRKEAGKNAFELPAELASIVSSPGDQFAAVLKDFGLTPAENDPETGAVKVWRYKSRNRPDGDQRPRRPHGQNNRDGQPVKQANHARKGDQGRDREKKHHRGDRPNHKRHDRSRPSQPRMNPADSPFAELAALFPDQPSASKPKKRRKPKPKRPPTEAPSSTADANHSEQSANPTGSTEKSAAETK